MLIRTQISQREGKAKKLKSKESLLPRGHGSDSPSGEEDRPPCVSATRTETVAEVKIVITGILLTVEAPEETRAKGNCPCVLSHHQSCP